MNFEIHYFEDKPEYLEQASRLLHDEFGHLNPGENLEGRVKRMGLRLQKASLPIAFVVTVDGQFAGTASLVKSDMDERPELTPWLASVAIPKEFRRKGIASKLCQFVMKEARKFSSDKFFLFTPDQENLYARLGWKTFEKTEYHGENITLMEFYFEDSTD